MAELDDARGQAVIDAVVQRARREYPRVCIIVTDERPAWWAIAIEAKGRVLVRGDLMWVYSRPIGHDFPLYECATMWPAASSRYLEVCIFSCVKEMIERVQRPDEYKP
jgi:hypothetical protein